MSQKFEIQHARPKCLNNGVLRSPENLCQPALHIKVNLKCWSKSLHVSEEKVLKLNTNLNLDLQNIWLGELVTK